MGLSASYAKDAVKAVGTAVIPFLFIFYGFYDIAWTPLSYTYVPPRPLSPLELHLTSLTR